LQDQDGRTGYGEIAPIPWFGTETLNSARFQLGLLGAEVHPETVLAIPASHPCCQAALGAAMEDLQGAPYPSGRRLPVSALLPMGDEAAPTLEERLTEGFVTAKIKIGVEDRDLEMSRVEALCGLLPDGGRLRLDANGGLDRSSAPAWLDFVAALPVEFLEQPFPPSDPDGLIGLAEDFPTPIALDESVVGVDDLKRWRDRGWPGFFVIKPSLAGPPAALRAEMGDDDVFVFSTAMETPIGHHAALRTAFLSASRRALGFGVGAFFADTHDEAFQYSDAQAGMDLSREWTRWEDGA
jgi:O-succinylbenzoate synthase